MIYCFLGDSNRDRDLFEGLFLYDWTGLTFNWNHQTETPKINHININIPINWDLDVTLDIDYNFILEYANKIYSKEHIEQEVKKILASLWHYLPKILKKEDIVIALNSGEYTSRLLKELSEMIGFKFFFLDSFYLNDTVQLSTIPFTKSKYGLPEFIELIKHDTNFEDHTQFITSYVASKKSKYNQDEVNVILSNLNIKYSELQQIDIFVPGQVPTDTNIILNEKINTEDLCEILCKTHPDKLIGYKPHPGAISILDLSKLKQYNNLIFLKDSVWNIFNKCNSVHTLSSTVGIEAMMVNKPVVWYSDFYSEYFKNISIHHFIAKCIQYGINRQNFTDYLLRMESYGTL